MNAAKKHLMLAWALSILLHLVFIFAVLYQITPVKGQDTEPTQSAVNQPIFADILPELAADSTNTQADIGVESAYPVDDKICNNKSSSYMGVGILYSYTTNIVSYAPEYYPGYKSGIRVGDRLLNPSAGVDQEGYMTLYVLRTGKELVFRAKAERICFAG